MSILNFGNYSRRKVVKLSATFLFILGVLFSCKKEENDIGLDLQEGSAGTVVVDTFTIDTYVDFDDSLRSTQTTKNLLGSYRDPEMGFVKTGFYTQLRLEANDPNLGTAGNIIVDSLVLALDFDGFYGQEYYQQNIEVYRVTENMDPEADYYRFSSLSNDGMNYEYTGTPYKPLHYQSVVVGTDTLDSHIRIKLDPNTMGQDLVSIWENGNMVDNDAFTAAFKGLYVTVNNGSQSEGEGGVLYFNLLSSISKMTLYYKDGAETKEFDFKINENAARFNVYENDYSGTHVEKVINNPEKGKERFYLQSGAIRAGVEFPYLDLLNELEEDVVIVKAELQLPIQVYEGTEFYIPETIYLLEQQTDGTQTFILDNYNPNHVGGDFDENDLAYKFIVTRYVQNILTGSSANTSLRVLSPKHFASVERVIFNGQEGLSKDKPKLIVTYTKY